MLSTLSPDGLATIGLTGIASVLGFIRARGGVDTQTFSYDDGKAVSDPTHIHIDITLNQKINLLWLTKMRSGGGSPTSLGTTSSQQPTSRVMELQPLARMSTVRILSIPMPRRQRILK